MTLEDDWGLRGQEEYLEDFREPLHLRLEEKNDDGSGNANTD